tara:strand:+ start:102 stop:1403 length:1302 start_codon:yes stop_codon:yes gene_type:complete
MKTLKKFTLAKKIIPGGTQLFSKKPELFAPGLWPGYYKKAKGVNIWDLDNKKYLDMSIMNVGACILGYADKDVDGAVKKVIKQGVSSSINAIEEFELAKLLLKLHPWAKKTRFARGGGEAMSIAVRIARTYTNREKILFSGYHGWNDWYLSSNIKSKKNLNKFLLAGLDPAGVPKSLMNSAIPFDDTNIDSFKKKINNKEHKIAAIVIEPARGNIVNEKYLKELKKISKKIGAILIFDEITSGFRMNTGGIHLLHNINPDIAVFAKSMANGYAMSAIIGTKEVMDAANKTFISSTNWTERVGPSAALATIKKCMSKKVFKHNIKIGKAMKKIWLKLSKKYGFEIEISGLDTLPSFSFKNNKNQKMQTYFTREMLKFNILAFRQFRPSFCHNKKHLSLYEKFAEKVFYKLSKKNYNKLSYNSIAIKSFSRITKE